MDLNRFNTVLAPAREALYAVLREVGPRTYTLAYDEGDSTSLIVNTGGQVIVTGYIPPRYATRVSATPKSLTLADLEFRDLAHIGEAAARELAIHGSAAAAKAAAAALDLIDERRTEINFSGVEDRLVPAGHEVAAVSGWDRSHGADTWSRDVTLDVPGGRVQGVIQVQFETGTCKIVSAELTNAATKQVLGRYAAPATPELLRHARMQKADTLVLGGGVLHLGYTLLDRGPWTGVLTDQWTQRATVRQPDGVATLAYIEVDFTSGTPTVRKMQVHMTRGKKLIGSYSV